MQLINFIPVVLNPGMSGIEFLMSWTSMVYFPLLHVITAAMIFSVGLKKKIHPIKLLLSFLPLLNIYLMIEIAGWNARVVKIITFMLTAFLGLVIYSFIKPYDSGTLIMLYWMLSINSGTQFFGFIWFLVTIAISTEMENHYPRFSLYRLTFAFAILATITLSILSKQDFDIITLSIFTWGILLFFAFLVRKAVDDGMSWEFRMGIAFMIFVLIMMFVGPLLMMLFHSIAN